MLPSHWTSDITKLVEESASANRELAWWTGKAMFVDILYERASVGDLPLPQPSPPGRPKCEHDSDSPIFTPPTTSPSEVPRTITRSHRIGR
ncbi:hypothetical protein F4604DRAFT_1976896 [Suillus subluteus]|nr:hypothetical protein F4604DRAFT_1976896 [Suillus subluteus]